jgi:hypothetical protein
LKFKKPVVAQAAAGFSFERRTSQRKRPRRDSLAAFHCLERRFDQTAM